MIKLENVSKYYYSSTGVVPALRKLKLEFSIGEFVAITGESGSGKSTLLNVISGLDTYDDGELYIDGEETSHFDDADWEEYRKNKIGFVFQKHDLIEHYSVLNNVESTLLIQGYSSKDAKNKAKNFIKRVGLGNKIYQRTSKLSNGQKQRLSIARALAKNTDIIVADEPTGNLDGETGKQIMELFGELAKDKLIIIVTHNYEEAAAYVTRRVRLHDGEVVSDMVTTILETESLSKTENDRDITFQTPGLEEGKNEAKTQKERIILSDKRIAGRFAYMNISTQPRRVLLYMLFLLITAAVSFLFLGDIYSNWDDTFIKKNADNFFYNRDEKRIVVKKPDGSDINAEDMERFYNIKYVQMADQYDFANDINYYFTFKTDYEYIYRSNDNPESTERVESVDFLHVNNFVKSSTCLIEEDLSTGRIPAKRNEVVIFSEDESVIGTQQICYFTSKNIWNYNQYYSTMVTVVGLLKKESNQVYFSEELCHMLSLRLYGDHYSVDAAKNDLTNEYEVEGLSIIPVIGENLEYGEVRLSQDVVVLNDIALAGQAVMHAYLPGDGVELGKELTFEVMLLEEYNDQSSLFAEISKEWFYELYKHGSKQASLYIKDYVYTDYVLDKLADLGYDALSPLRVSTTDYDYDKVYERNNIIFRSLIVLLIVSILEIIIIRSLLRIRNKDFVIFRSLGMNHRTVKLINYYEMFIYTTVSVFVLIAGARILSLFPFGYLQNMIKYYNFYTYTIYITINFSVILVTVWLSNRFFRLFTGFDERFG